MGIEEEINEETCIKNNFLPQKLRLFQKKYVSLQIIISLEDYGKNKQSSGYHGRRRRESFLAHEHD
jgi:hypothetical protein